ncbi:hypothetical protein PMIN06_009679 [Paraphaeosphaeria minitans]
MAVIEAVPYVSVQVLANGTPFPEFDDDDDAGNNTANSITKYIEVTTGEAFSIQYRTKPAFVPKHNFSVSMYTFEGLRERTSAGHFSRKLIFSGITTSDSCVVAASDDLKKALTQIGTICVKFFWISIQGTSAKKFRASAFTKVGAIPEKAPKGRAVSNQTECGPREAIQPFTTIATKNLHGGKPFAEFHFKYRSRKDLKALLIIPRSPSPVPLDNRDIETL